MTHLPVLLLRREAKPIRAFRESEKSNGTDKKTSGRRRERLHRPQQHISVDSDDEGQHRPAGIDQRAGDAREPGLCGRLVNDVIKAGQKLMDRAMSCPRMIDGQMLITHVSLAALPDGKCHPSVLCSGRPWLAGANFTRSIPQRTNGRCRSIGQEICAMEAFGQVSAGRWHRFFRFDRWRLLPQFAQT